MTIPKNNRGWTGREGIDSVLVQECPDFELIIVNDRSADDIADILASYELKLKERREDRVSNEIAILHIGKVVV